MYFTGDGANRYEDGDYTITGRMDDVINISGHRLGTAEIEDCMVTHILLLLFCYKIFFRRKFLLLPRLLSSEFQMKSREKHHLHL